VAGEFETVHVFQNFLPVTPPAQWEKDYRLTGIQAVRITDAGTGYKPLATDVINPEEGVRPTAKVVSKTRKGSGAELLVLLEPYTDRIQQIDVKAGGEGYENGDPPEDISVEIGSPPLKPLKGGRQAKARAQVSGGKVVAVFMTDNGSGYRSSIQPKAPDSGAEPDPAIIPLIKDAWDDPDPKNSNRLRKGLVPVITGGAGWFAPGKEPPRLIVQGQGDGAKAEAVGAGQITRIVHSGVGGFTDAGRFPSTSDQERDCKRIKVHIPPARGEKPEEVQQARVSKVRMDNKYYRTLLVEPGEGYVSPKAFIKLANDKKIEMINLNLDSKGGFLHPEPREDQRDFAITKPIKVEFESQKTPTRAAEAWVLPGCEIEAVELVGKPSSKYEHDLEIAFSGGDVRGVDLDKSKSAKSEMPEFDFKDGGLEQAKLKNEKESPFYHRAPFRIDGGKGFNAALKPVCEEIAKDKFKVVAVKVMRPGSNYPKAVRAYTDPGQKELDVIVVEGCIVNVSLKRDIDYTFPTIPAIFLTAESGALDWVNNPAKGKVATFTVDEGGVKVTVTEKGARYLPDTGNRATQDSLPAIARFSWVGEVAPADLARGFIAEVAKPKVKVEQVLYDSIIAEFSTMASDSLKPFGGKFGGKTAPDGYGLGNALSSATKVLGVLYNLHQYHSQYKRDVPLIAPSKFVLDMTVGGNPKYIRNNPLITLKGGLKTMTQALQRTISLFFQETPYTNNPDKSDWKMAYFAMYDKAGRVVVNPTATIPVYGVVSSVKDPPEIPDAQNDKTGLKKWRKGHLWSGFGVSDQWNDQHYFYGYYLSAAGILAVLDGSWDADKPAKLWSDPDRIGTAVDQWMKTLAYDPRLDKAYYDFGGKVSQAGIEYEKYSYFDQWNGFSWATGVSPGRAGDVESGVPWSTWSALGTGNAPYDDENENSTWEGLQAFSAMILWGAGTNRKVIVDQGMYLLTTAQAASDLYFLDKNYNLKRGDQNKYSWCPVTTAAPVGTGEAYKSGNSYEKGTGYVDSNPQAFYGEASAGCSILHKGSPSLNNFFYAYPTGSKFIQAFPPTPWTMGMSRNLGYMKKWAEAMTRLEWKQARDSALFQRGNWLGMAMSSALCGSPYNPGDDPKKVRPYVERLWASWIVAGQAPGSQATTQPADTPTSVLNFLHTLEEYGPPDWSIYAKAVDASGKEVDDQIVFTAAFTKERVTTLVAFNPTWKTCYVNFFGIGADGALSDAPIHQNPIRVDPKKMTVQRDLIGRVALITDNLDGARGLLDFLATYGGESSIVSLAVPSKLSLTHPEVVIFCPGPNASWAPDRWVTRDFENYKVVGMGYQAIKLFRSLGLEISGDKWGYLPSGSEDLWTVELAEVLEYPEAIPSSGGALQVAGKDIGDAWGVWGNLPDLQGSFERIARYKNHAAYWTVARQGNYLLWGLDASVDQMTEAGKRLFVNVLINHKLHKTK
jgi:hypothetical protein